MSVPFPPPSGAPVVYQQVPKKKFYRRVWFWIPVVVIMFTAIGASASQKKAVNAALATSPTIAKAETTTVEVATTSTAPATTTSSTSATTTTKVTAELTNVDMALDGALMSNITLLSQQAFGLADLATAGDIDGLQTGCGRLIDTLDSLDVELRPYSSTTAELLKESYTAYRRAMVACRVGDWDTMLTKMQEGTELTQQATAAL